MKKILSIILTIAVALFLVACGGGQNSSSPQNEEKPKEATTEIATEATVAETTTEIKDPTVETIDYSCELGKVKYIGFEKADPELTDEDDDDAVIFKFEFTNLQNEPKQFQQCFVLRCYQNGVELTKNVSYSGHAKEQFELVGAFFNNALKDGTVTFGKLVDPEDDSPITITVQRNDGTSIDVCQMMEVNIKSDDAEVSDEKQEDQNAVSEDEIKDALQGTWLLESSNATFVFSDEKVSINDGELEGTYTINKDEGNVECTIDATDGQVLIKLPFSYDGSTLTLSNNKNEELKKQ